MAAMPSAKVFKESEREVRLRFSASRAAAFSLREASSASRAAALSDAALNSAESRAFSPVRAASSASRAPVFSLRALSAAAAAVRASATDAESPALAVTRASFSSVSLVTSPVRRVILPSWERMSSVFLWQSETRTAFSCFSFSTVRAAAVALFSESARLRSRDSFSFFQQRAELAI